MRSSSLSSEEKVAEREAAPATSRPPGNHPKTLSTTRGGASQRALVGAARSGVKVVVALWCRLRAVENKLGFGRYRRFTV